MDWSEFIKEISRQKLPSEKHRVTFIEIFSDNESQKIDKTIEGHLREIYKRFETVCPALTKAKKGKKEILREYLQNLYAIQGNDVGISDRPQPRTNYPNVPTPDRILELTTLDFIGRDRDVTELDNVRKKHKIVLIKAGGGVGKSTLAQEFLRSQFKKVIRLEMGMEFKDITPANQKVSQILQKEFNQQPSLDFGINLDILRERLSDRNNPIALLIDNLEPALGENYRFRENLRGYDSLLSVLGDRDVFSFTLITSRRSLITERAKVYEYSLEGLDITAWRQYFHDCHSVEDSGELMHMYDAYSGNAKAMDILHSAAKKRFGGSIKAYWDRYNNASLAHSELETLISVEMDWLQDNQPNAYKLLCRMGCYRYQDVKAVPFEAVICLLWDIPESQKILVIDYLSKTSLIEIKDGYYLHPAVRESTLSRLKLDDVDWEMTNLKAGEFWTQSITSITTIEDALRAFKAYHHYINISKYELACNVIIQERNNYWEDNESLGKSFHRLGFLESIKLAINKIINYLPNSHNLGKLHNILGEVHLLMGEISESICYYEKSRKIAVEFAAKDIEVEAFFNIGLCQIDVWEIQFAIENFEKCIQLATDENHANYIVQSYYCLSFLNSLTSKEMANSFIEKTFEDFNLTNCSAWSTGYRWLFLGRAYMYLFDTKKAFDMFTIARTYAEERYYPQVKGNALTGLASVLRTKNDWDRTISFHHESIDILRTIGAKCDLAEAYFQLGLTYQAMGEHDQAEEYKAKALELFTKIQAPKQIERVNKSFKAFAQLMF
jgi:tetratricopeptide (TPR) repeat protein